MTSQSGSTKHQPDAIVKGAASTMTKDDCLKEMSAVLKPYGLFLDWRRASRRTREELLEVANEVRYGDRQISEVLQTLEKYGMDFAVSNLS